jgi:hypothetical protein
MVDTDIDQNHQKNDPENDEMARRRKRGTKSPNGSIEVTAKM